MLVFTILGKIITKTCSINKFKISAPDFSYIEVWCTDQNSYYLETEDRINLVIK